MTTESLNQRLRDLVRYHRSELFRENLITEEEYADLVSNTPGAVDRLHDYDRVRTELAELKATVELHKVALANMTIERDLAKAELEKATHGLIAQRKMNEATHAAYHDVSTVIHLPSDNGAEMLRKVATERDAIATEASMLRTALEGAVKILSNPAAPIAYISHYGPKINAALATPSQAAEWLAKHDKKTRADELAKCEVEWNKATAFASQPKTPSMREIIDAHDAKVISDFLSQLKDAPHVVKLIDDVRRETLNQFTVWLLKTHGLLIDESLLAPHAPETAPATPNEPPKALQPEDAGNFTHVSATSTPYVCDICNTWHSAGEKPCPVPVDRER